MKKILSCFLAVLIVFGYGFSSSAEEEAVSAMIKTAAEYVYKTADNPGLGSVGGEWAVLGLARSTENIPEDYFENYKKNLTKVLKESQGILHKRKYTEYSRVVIALTAIGCDPQNAEGYDLILPLEDFEKTVWQGINGAIWALIALDCAGYGSKEIREAYLDYILSLELDGGGWSLSEKSKSADADITAMALVALSAYQGNPRIDEAISKAVLVLSDMQNENGGYMGFEAENAESAAQVLTAISAIGISYLDERFVKSGNSIVDYLKRFSIGGGFMHTFGDASPNLMTTEQCLYALVAAERCLLGKNALFDMSDRQKDISLPQSLDVVSRSVVKYPHKSFEDIKGYGCQTAVEALAERGIINGMTDTTFAPNGTMTRAEFSTITVNALGLSAAFDKVFEDVQESDWFFSYISTAYKYRIVNGVSETAFLPNGTITRAEAATMLTRAAALCGLDTDMSGYSVRDILSVFPDYTEIPLWAQDAMAYCCMEKILDTRVIRIMPKETVTRGEIAQMIYNLLGKAELL